MPRTAFWGSFINHDSSPDEQENAKYIAEYNKQHQELVHGSHKFMQQQNMYHKFNKNTHVSEHPTQWHEHLHNQLKHMVDDGQQWLTKTFNPNSNKKYINTTTRSHYNLTGLYIAN